MPWIALGTVEPNLLNWQAFSAPAFESLFRVRQTWNGEWPGAGYIRLRAVQSDGSFYETKSIYATRDQQLLVLPPSAALAEAGYFVRRFEIRLNLRARIFATANWQVSIDEYSASTADDPFQIVNGGVYAGS